MMREMMKRIIDFFKAQFVFVLITATIICSGLFVPRIILSFKSNSKIIAKGRVDAAGIQPYGADVIMTEQYISNCLDFLDMRLVFDTQDPSDQLSNRYRLSNCSQNRLGRISWTRDIGDNYTYPVPREGFELTQRILSITADSYYTNFLGDQILISAESSGANPGSVYAVMTRSDNIFMEPHTGVPVAIDVKFASPGFPDLDTYGPQIVAAYAETTGIQFVEEVLDYRYDYVDGYDTSATRAYRSSDGRFVLTVSAASGWYWTYDSNEANWESTDNYLWNIMINLEQNRF